MLLMFLNLIHTCIHTCIHYTERKGIITPKRRIPKPKRKQKGMIGRMKSHWQLDNQEISLMSLINTRKRNSVLYVYCMCIVCVYVCISMYVCVYVPDLMLQSITIIVHYIPILIYSYTHNHTHTHTLTQYIFSFVCVIVVLYRKHSFVVKKCTFKT